MAEEGRIKLDGAQVRAIQDAKRQSFDLEKGLRDFEKKTNARGGAGASGGVLDRIKRFEAFATRILGGVTALGRAADRLDSFFESGLISGGARRGADVVTGALRGAQSLAFIPIAGPLAGAAAGAYLGSKVAERRLQGDRQVLEIQNQQAQAERELEQRLRDDFLRRQKDHATGFFGPLGVHVRRARQGRAR